jgi:hypothetical protein
VSTIPTITEQDIRTFVGEQNFLKGQHYVRDGARKMEKVNWDIRLHPIYPTIEFRVCDMPATFEDMIALAALCQALVAKLDWLHERGMMTTVLPAYFIYDHFLKNVEQSPYTNFTLLCAFPHMYRLHSQ